MQRIPEPELMDGDEQSLAYSRADFGQPNRFFLKQFSKHFPGPFSGTFLDLGCGPAEICILFAGAYPESTCHGLDGAAKMLEHGRRAIAEAGLEKQILLFESILPAADLPLGKYDAVISNSLLHHLADPLVLWETLRQAAKPGAPLLVMDLLRPTSKKQAREIVETYSSTEPRILKEDFYRSLLAAYRLEEIEAQLAQSGLGHLVVERASDRHCIMHGRAA